MSERTNKQQDFDGKFSRLYQKQLLLRSSFFSPHYCSNFSQWWLSSQKRISLCVISRSSLSSKIMFPWYHNISSDSEEIWSNLESGWRPAPQLFSSPLQILGRGFSCQGSAGVCAHTRHRAREREYQLYSKKEVTELVEEEKQSALCVCEAWGRVRQSRAAALNRHGRETDPLPWRCCVFLERMWPVATCQTVHPVPNTGLYSFMGIIHRNQNQLGTNTYQPINQPFTHWLNRWPYSFGGT